MPVRSWLLWLALLSGSSAARAGQAPSAPDVPFARIIYSSDIEGYLEPCGCGGVNEGGIARRATLVERLRAEVPSVVISGGNFGGVAEAVSSMLSALSRMRYDYVIPNSADLGILPTALDEAARLGLPAVPRSRPGAQVEPHQIQLGGLRIQLLAVGPIGPDEPTLCSGFAAEACDLLLVVAEPMPAAARDRLARALGDQGFTSVLLASASPRAAQWLQARGHCLVPELPDRGRALVLIDCWPASDAAGFRISVRREPVSAALAPDAEVQRIATEYYDARRRASARGDRTAAVSPGGPSPTPSKPWLDPRVAYAPAEACGSCHPRSYERWRGSRHARALQTLAAGDRVLPECLRCHSTPYALTGELPPPPYGAGDGVECAACHGDGVVHALTRRPRFVTRCAPAERCMECHTPQDSPAFGGSYFDRLSCSAGKDGEG